MAKKFKTNALRMLDKAKIPYSIKEYEYDEEQQRHWDKEEGENRFAALTQLLLKEQQTEKLLRATKDKNYREKLYQEYNL